MSDVAPRAGLSGMTMLVGGWLTGMAVLAGIPGLGGGDNLKKSAFTAAGTDENFAIV